MPLPVLRQQSTAPTPSPIPPGSEGSPPSSAIESSAESKHVKTPRLLLEVRDLSSAGAQDFLRAIRSGSIVEEYVRVVLNLLYAPGCSVPPTRSVTLVVRSMPGVAYTTGKDIDEDHKEIHLSTDYISHVRSDRRHLEILGVLTHELVHCFQWNADGTAPDGLTEGIADWVRLNCGLAPPHWHRDADGEWDAGYEHTGYFLDYLEERFGYGTVRKINQSLKKGKYVERTFWSGLFHCSVKKLWDDYGKWVEKQADNQKRVDASDQKMMRVNDDDGGSEKLCGLKVSTDLGATPTSLSGGGDDES